MKHIATLACCLSLTTANVAAQTLAPERIINIERATADIGAIQKQSGSNGAFAAITQCYKRELPRATKLTPQLEACMAQDIVVSHATAVFFAKLNSEGRRKAGGEEPADVLKAMQTRVVGTMARFNVPQDQALAFSGMVKTKGMEAYARAQFPDHFPQKKN
jgi:hypothetical protein